MKTLFFKKDALTAIPSETGVYFFLKKDIPLYIGKALNLRARIASHVRSSELDQKEKQIISQTDRIKIITISSEFNALMYEAELIKQYKPKYNIILKDGKTSLYIKITESKTYPKIFPVRYENERGSQYFGPFQSHQIVMKVLREIRHIVPFCSQKKMTKRGCFYSKIGLCNPCPNTISHIQDKEVKKKAAKEYKKQIRIIRLILQGKSDIVLRSLTRRMAEKSRVNNYEDALSIRDTITFFRKLIAERSFHENVEKYTVGFPIEQLICEFNTFMKNYFGQSHERDTYTTECYDISHLFGSHATASMVVFHDGQPYKKKYRRFRIQTVRHISDVDMIKEVIDRRLKRKEWKLPDIIVVDGGKPQLIAVTQTLTFHQLSIPCIGFAKSPDRIIVSNPPQTIYLSENSALLLLFKYIRDESHRFAKKYHTLLRNKNFFTTNKV
ncbi:MAG TPA: GIY-YIG nuclease family protein [Patescibacteria group bacterium]|nr:GIY-YIG nuclease family protein [Patescibacteria group bacterium]